MRIAAWLVAVTVLGGAAWAQEPASGEASLKSANDAYLAGDAAGALAGYRRLLDEGWESPDLYFDAGNAAFKADQLGWAVLYYERALQLDPGDEDARFNLGEARKTAVDKLVGGPGPDDSFYERLVARIPAGAAGAAFAATWVAFFGLILARRFLTSPAARGWLLGLSVTAGLAAAVSGAAFAAAYDERERVSHGVVVAEAAVVREGPDPALKALFEVHEGLKVRLLDQHRGHARIRLPNGLEGWVAESEVEKI